MAGRRRGKQWVRLWGEVVRTPKIAKLTDSQFRWWINLLAIATEYDGEGEGRLQDDSSIAWILHTTEAEVAAAIAELRGLRLIDVDGDGTRRMHDYRQWQEGDVPATPVPPPVKRKPATKAAVVPAGDQALSPIQAAVAGYCDAAGMDPTLLGGTYGRYSKAFMGIAAAGYTRDDVRRLTCFVGTAPYWQEKRATPSPESVVSQVGAWLASGKPDRWTPGMRPVSVGRVSIAGAAARPGG